MADDEGVLGNLPRSRPGQRSKKREAGGAAKSARGSDPRNSARPKPAAGPRRVAGASGDPVGDAIRTVTGIAATGARVANDVAREVLRRLPRP